MQEQAQEEVEKPQNVTANTPVTQPQKKKHGCLWALLVVIGLILIIGIVLIASCSKALKEAEEQEREEIEKEKVVTDTEAEGETIDEEAIEVTQVDIEEFMAEFDDNQLAAEEKYKDKWVRMEAKIRNISDDIFGTPFLSLEPVGSDEFTMTSVKCNFEDAEQLMEVKNGEIITVQGKVSSQDLGVISLRHCEIVGE